MTKKEFPPAKMPTDTPQVRPFRAGNTASWTLLVVVVMGLAVTGWGLYAVSDHAKKTAAIQNAVLLSNSVASFRSLYTTAVVTQLEPGGIQATHKTSGDAGTIPLPIALSLELAREIGAETLESEVRIYSPYSFPWKGEGGLPDAFAQEAWAQLSIAPDEPVMRFDQRDGRAILRYASSDLMNAQCVECHNSYPGTPKTDWKPGDVRGVVEVSLPIEPEAALAGVGVAEHTFLFLSLAALWISAAGLSFWASRSASKSALAQAHRYRTTSHELQDAICERELAEREARQLESQIQHAQKLESLNLMTGGLAHDFNNLLVPIIANADILKAEFPPKSEGLAVIREIDLAASRAADLCHQMLAYAGKTKPERKRVDLNLLLEETVQLMAVSLSKRCKLELDLAKGLPPIDADVVQIGQVVLNLLTNASEALTDGGGTVWVRTGRCRAAGCRDGSLDASSFAPTAVESSSSSFEVPMVDAVFFEVCDEGVGMSKETIQKIFDPFYSTKFAGRGLGLAAVQGIIQAHGGALQVESELGKSTRMRAMIPAADEMTSALRAFSPPPLTDWWTGSGTILLADDEESVQDVVQRMLERIGFHVVTACDGALAAKIFQRAPDRFVAVLLDLTMPRWGGIRALRAMREIRPDLPAILFSGYSEQISEIETLAGGATLFMQKPFRSQTLRKKLQTLVGDPAGSESAGASAPPETTHPAVSHPSRWRRWRTGSGRSPGSVQRRQTFDSSTRIGTEPSATNRDT